ncbi:UNVERIFIED_CONTAM: hypothetical protein PYX00_007013 [Menopon gallinae]|uniref:Thiamine transporter 2 n=1 Tax=Menopon gallinae TaxID=328185 RepID=A0AAW2HHC6_9NEOP
MNKWWHISLLLSCYGFFKEYRPSEPFITPFLTGPGKNFTNEEVTQEIYAVGIYFNLSLLVLVFLLTDYLRYKPVLIAGGISGIIVWTLLIVGKTIPVMQVVEFFYGFFMASEVAYYTYIYAKVDKEHYQKVTSHTRTAFLLGKASAGLSSQLLVEFHVLDYLQLNYITVCALAMTTLVSILLPSVPQSIYFHRCESSANTSNSSGQIDENNKFGLNRTAKKHSCKSKFKSAFTFLYEDLREAYTNSYVLEWSLWWGLATCGYLQIATYSQVLWEEINKAEEVKLKNGLVEFVYSILGAAAAFGIGYIKLPWQKWGEFTLGILTLVQAACIFGAAYLTNLYFAYAVYIAFGILYHSAITIASSEVAKDIREDSYALIFGINTFFALILQTILTAIVVNYLKCVIRTQFQIYGCYLFVTGGVYLVISFYTLFKYRPKRSLDLHTN